MTQAGATRSATRPLIVSHLRAAIGAVTLALAFMTWLHYDRSPPFEYIDTEISPSPVVEGEPVTVSRYVEWHRRCDGKAYREIVAPSRHPRPGRIIGYDRVLRPFPYSLGTQNPESDFIAPPIDDKTLDRGMAVYRGRIEFDACGWTSRLWPIVIPFQEVTFEVVRRQ